jgi:DNA-binding ferritin-like protein
MAYESFWRNVRERAERLEPFGGERSGQKYLDINPEGTILRETQDIAEELRIMAHIYTQQFNVVKDFENYLSSSEKETQRATDLLEQITNRQSEIKKLEHAVSRTNQQVRRTGDHHPCTSM